MVCSKAGQVRTPVYWSPEYVLLSSQTLTRGKEGSDCQYPQITYKGQQVALMVFSSGLSFCSCIGNAQHSFQGSMWFSSLNHPMPKSSHKGRRCHLQDQADMRRSFVVRGRLSSIFIYHTTFSSTWILPLDHSFIRPGLLGKAVSFPYI